MAELGVSADRVWNSLMEMARIGATPKGGVCRLALTIDLGCPDDQQLAQMHNELKAGVARIASEGRLEHQLEQIFQVDCVHFDPGCRATLIDRPFRMHPWTSRNRPSSCSSSSATWALRWRPGCCSSATRAACSRRWPGPAR